MGLIFSLPDGAISDLQPTPTDLIFSLPNDAIGDTLTAPKLVVNRRRGFQRTPAVLIFSPLNSAIGDLSPTSLNLIFCLPNGANVGRESSTWSSAYINRPGFQLTQRYHWWLWIVNLVKSTSTATTFAVNCRSDLLPKRITKPVKSAAPKSKLGT